MLSKEFDVNNVHFATFEKKVTKSVSNILGNKDIFSRLLNSQRKP